MAGPASAIVPAERGRDAAAQGADGNDDTWQALLGEKSTAVGRMRRVEAPKGLRLRTGPSAGAATMAILPFDTLVHVERKTEHGWYYVVSMGDAHGGGSVTGAGCVEGQHVELDPPEPTAHLHFVKPGEMLKDIAAQHYKPRRGFEWGADARLHVEAIWEANKGTGKLTRVGGDLSWDESLVRSDKQEKTLAIWRSVQPKHNHAIWIPSQAFVDALDKAGAISGGSISHAAWQTAEQAAQALVDFAQYRAGYVVGVLEGVFAAARDVVMGVVDLLGLVHDLLKLLITEGLVGAAQSIGGKLVELFKRAPDLLAQAGAWFVRNWTQDDDFDRGEFQGEVIGYILAQVLLAIVTMGESVALQATGRFASFIKVVRALDVSADILTYARGAARVARLPADALARLRKAARGAGDAGDAAGDVRRQAGGAASEGTATAAHARDEASAPETTRGGGRDVDNGTATPGLAPAATKGQARVNEPKPGLFDRIDPDKRPSAWTFIDGPVRTEADGTRVIETSIVVNGKQGFMERAYNPQTKVLEMRNAFLEDLPRWVDEGTPMVAGRGTPTVTYLTVRHMKLLGVGYGQLAKVKMSTIQNLKAIIQLHVLRTKGVDPNVAVLRTHSVQYAETAIIQSGHSVVAAEVKGNIWNRKLGMLMRHFESGDPAIAARHDELIKELGEGMVTRETEVWMNYDIELEVAPFAPRQATPGGVP